jgi:hypothetical protein
MIVSVFLPVAGGGGGGRGGNGARTRARTRRAAAAAFFAANRGKTEIEIFVDFLRIFSEKVFDMNFLPFFLIVFLNSPY